MGVLFMMPEWSVPSQLWLKRMLHALESDLACIACRRPATRWWRGTVPTVDIAPSVFERLRGRLALPASGRSDRVLGDAVRSSNVSCVLVHFIPLALRYRRLWDDTDKPLFVHCHGYDVTWSFREHVSGAKPYFREDYPERVRRLAARAVLIANSKFTAEKLWEIGVPRDRVVIRYFGVPSPDEMPRRPPRTSELTVLFLGRLADCKGPERVIEAFELACERGFDGRLLMAGGGPLEAACRTLASRSPFADRIEILGPVDAEMGELLRREADLFTAHNCKGRLTNQEEAFGVSFAEAMGDGLPVITGRSGATPEVVEDGVTGILFKPGDVEAHAQALVTLGSDPERRHRMGEASWRCAREFFPMSNEWINLRAILRVVPAAGDRKPGGSAK